MGNKQKPLAARAWEALLAPNVVQAVKAEAYKLLQCSIGFCSPNPPVAAVVFNRFGQIIGRGYHSRAGGPHAEIVALGSIPLALKHLIPESFIYVTLEPCSTIGRTGSCCEALIRAGLRGVIWEEPDSTEENGGKASAILKAAGISNFGPTNEIFTSQTLLPWRFFKKWGRPYVTLKVATTADGSLRPENPTERQISGQRASTYTQYLRSRHDAILVGAETVRQDDPLLTNRYELFTSPRRYQPWRVILNGSGNLPPHAKVLTDEHAARTIILPKLSVSEILENLAQRGITSVLVEGGGNVIQQFLAADAVNTFVHIESKTPIGSGPNLYQTNFNLWKADKVAEKPTVLKSDTLRCYQAT
jgi:diaminohydroxyphosphoribosylaminopyrimidine deaminase/5-amino-6-(5-phosphoribosylamino)uracil reductase